jgi:hypothetical protein
MISEQSLGKMWPHRREVAKGELAAMLSTRLRLEVKPSAVEFDGDVIQPFGH